MLCCRAKQGDDGHCRCSAVKRLQTARQCNAFGLNRLTEGSLNGRFRFIKADGRQHALVKIVAQMDLRFALFILEQGLVALEFSRNVLLAEERAQNAFLGLRGFALPVAFQELFDVFIVHNYQIFRIAFSEPYVPCAALL